MLIAAALIAFLSAFIPLINQTRILTEYSETVVQEKIFLNTLAEDARRARLLGDGNSFSKEFFLPAERTELSFDEGRQTLEIVFTKTGRTSALEEFLGFPVVMNDEIFGEEKITYSLENDDGLIVVSFSSRSRRDGEVKG
jgi:hypothetical protein